MKNRRFTITQEDYLLANRRAARQEEIDAHGKQLIFRTHLQKSRKVYDRNSLKRAAIKSDDGSYCLSVVKGLMIGTFKRFFLVKPRRYFYLCDGCKELHYG